MSSRVNLTISLHAPFAGETEALVKVLRDAANYVESSAVCPAGYNEIRNDKRGFTLRSGVATVACNLFNRFESHEPHTVKEGA